MKPIPVTEETRDVATRIIWFEAPEHALREPIRFMAYAMRYARHEDMRVLRRHVSDDDIREALDKAPPGIIDPRSWAYWNSKMGRYPPPPLPARSFTALSGPNGIRTNDTASSRGIESSQELRLEEIRRSARENWRAKHGDDKKTD